MLLSIDRDWFLQYNKIKKTLLLLLFMLAFVMIIIGLNSKMIAPALTGIGFLIIAGLFYTHR